MRPFQKAQNLTEIVFSPKVKKNKGNKCAVNFSLYRDSTTVTE